MPRFPRIPSVVAQARESLMSGVEVEIAQEQASALGGMGRRLEAAIADLAAFDAGSPVDRHGRRWPARDELVAEARQALWYLIVQREALGLWSGTDILAAYSVPREISRGVFHAPIVWRRKR